MNCFFRLAQVNSAVTVKCPIIALHFSKSKQQTCDCNQWKPEIILKLLPSLSACVCVCVQLHCCYFKEVNVNVSAYIWWNWWCSSCKKTQENHSSEGVCVCSNYHLCRGRGVWTSGAVKTKSVSWFDAPGRCTMKSVHYRWGTTRDPVAITSAPLWERGGASSI